MANKKQMKQAYSKRKKITTPVVFISTAVFICVTACLCRNYLTETYPSADNTTLRNSNWAQPIDLPGLPNLYKVSDDLYRSAQPTEEGMQQLENIGIKTVINLRLIHSDRDEIEEKELDYERIKVATWNPEIEDIVRFLKVVNDSNNTPVLVHCQHGADRTGTMCAIYRIVVQGWSKEQAIEEMTLGGFGFHKIWDNLADYIRELNIDEIKKNISDL